MHHIKTYLQPKNTSIVSAPNTMKPVEKKNYGTNTAPSILKNTEFPCWIGKLFLFLSSNYAFFDRAAKEDEDKDIALKTIWFQKLGKYSEKEIFDAFEEVITYYKNKFRDPTAAEYEEIILFRKRRLRQKEEEAKKQNAERMEKPALCSPTKEQVECSNMRRCEWNYFLNRIGAKIEPIETDKI